MENCATVLKTFLLLSFDELRTFKCLLALCCPPGFFWTFLYHFSQLVLAFKKEPVLSSHFFTVCFLRGN